MNRNEDEAKSSQATFVVCGRKLIGDVNAATSLASGNGVGILAYGGNVNLTITDTAAGNKLAVVANSSAVMERLATMRSELAQNQRQIVSVNRIRSTSIGIVAGCHDAQLLNSGQNPIGGNARGIFVSRSEER
jgi:hypothetical protein